MKITIESELFNGTTTNLQTARELLNMLNQQDFIEATALSPAAADISNDKYLTITAADITIGGESTAEYNGNEIYNRDYCMTCVKEVSKSFVKEYGASLEELHVVQANNVAGEPVPDAQGTCAWLRCVFNVNGERKVSRWVFRGANGSVADCGSFCALNCGDYVRYGSGFRAGVFGSVGD